MKEQFYVAIGDHKFRKTLPAVLDFELRNFSVVNLIACPIYSNFPGIERALVITASTGLTAGLYPSCTFLLKIFLIKLQITTATIAEAATAAAAEAEAAVEAAAAAAAVVVVVVVVAAAAAATTTAAR